MKPAAQLLSAGLLLASGDCLAGGIELEWADPSTYTDIAPGIGTRAAKLTSVQHAFADAFAQSAAALPEGYLFKARITDVDLAGQVNPPQAMDPNLMNTRVLTQNYFPAIILSYTLTDAGGKVLASGEDILITDMDYLSRTTSANASTPYYYEDRMIRSWFGRSIVPAVK